MKQTPPLTDDDREAFRAWLEARPADRILPVNCSTCPIAQFLRDRDGKDWRVRSATFGVGGNNTYALPRWARVFVRAYDDMALAGHYPTASLALLALKSV